MRTSVTLIPAPPKWDRLLALIMMGFGCDSRSIASRTTSIFVGMMTTLLWLQLAYLMAIQVYPIRVCDCDRDASLILRAPFLAAILCSLISSAMSAVMVFGAVKKIAGCISPWLAIHFVLLMMSAAMAFSVLFIMTLVDGVKSSFVNSILMTLIISVLIYCWGSVYGYYKLLNFPIKEEIISLDKETLKNDDREKYCSV